MTSSRSIQLVLHAEGLFVGFGDQTNAVFLEFGAAGAEFVSPAPGTKECAGAEGFGVGAGVRAGQCP